MCTLYSFSSTSLENTIQKLHVPLNSILTNFLQPLRYSTHIHPFYCFPSRYVEISRFSSPSAHPPSTQPSSIKITIYLIKHKGKANGKAEKNGEKIVFPNSTHPPAICPSPTNNIFIFIVGRHYTGWKMVRMVAVAKQQLQTEQSTVVCCFTLLCKRLYNQNEETRTNEKLCGKTK